MVPELPYTLHTRYKSIAIAWTVILIPPTLLNCGLFYGLWYGRPDLDRVFVLTLPTAILGIFTAIAIVERVYKLTKASDEFRPVGSPRYALDVFQWGYFLALGLIATLITTTLARGDDDNDNHELQLRLISLPPALLMFLLATLTLLSLTLRGLRVKLPFRLGSKGAGNVPSPAVYYVVEDVVAVDGGGGLDYRVAFAERYNSSQVFQDMIRNVSLAWMLYFYGAAIAFAALVFTLPVSAVYAVGWAGPFLPAGFMAFVTIRYVKTMLKKEEKEALVNEQTPLLR